MAKQSMKQQIYESIANSQVQQVMAQKREQELAALQADFSGFMQQQQNPEALMADFNSFMQSQQPKSQPVQTQKIPSLSDHQKLVNKAVEERTRLAALDKKKAEEQKTKEENRSIVSGISQRLQDSVLPKKKEESKKVEQPNVVAQPTTQTNDVDKWLSPDYKLTDEDKKAAKEYAQAELQKFDYGPNRQPLLESNEDRQHYADMVNLLNKTNTLTNAMAGVIKQPAALGRAVRDAGKSVVDQLSGLGAAVTDKLGVTEGATQRHNDRVEAANHFNAQNDANMELALANAKTQNPIATTAGEIGGQVAMYALTNPMFDALGAAAGLGKAGSFALNQVGQNAQDLALDTIPMLNNYLEGGVSDEERKELLKNIGINAAGNLAMGAVGEGIGALAKNRAARKAADEAFRTNALEGADKLARLAGTEDIDNVVRNATRQAEEAAQSIDDLAMQIQKTDTSDSANFNKFAVSNEPKVYIDPVDRALSNPDIVKSHTPEEINAMKEYSNAIDPHIVQMQQDFLKGNHIEPYEIKIIDAKLARDLKKVTGLDSEGRRIMLDRSSLKHINNEHGIYGKKNTSMADPNSLARIKYVLDNYDEVLFPDPSDAVTRKISLSDNSPSPKAIIRKKIDDHYFVVVASSDAKKGKDLTVSAYIDNDLEFKNNLDHGKLARVADAVDDTSSPLLTSIDGHEAAAKENTNSISNSNITDAISEVNKNSVNTSGNIEVDVSGPRPYAKNQGVSPSIENAAEAIENAAKTQQKYSVDSGVDNPNLTRQANDEINSYLYQLEDPFNNPDVNEAVGNLASKVTSDEGFKLLDDYNNLSRQLRELAEDNPAIREQLAELRKGINSVDKAERDALKDLLDYADIENAIVDYKRALNGIDEEAIDKAAKSLDAARNRVARRNNADATLKEAFGGSYGPIINRPKNAFELKPDESLIDEMVEDWAKQDIENPNRFVRDAEPDTKIKNHLGGKVMAEDTGLTPEDSFKIEEEIPDKGAFVEDGKSRVVTNSAINSDIVTKAELENDPVIQDIAKYAKHRNDITFAEAYDRVNLHGKQWKDDYISGTKAIADDTDVDTSMLLLQDLKNKMDNATDPQKAALYANERNALLRKLREYGTKSGQGIQAFAKWNNTADGALLTATKVQEDDVIKPWISKNQKTVKGNSRIARALSDMGNKWRTENVKPQLTHEQIKQGVKAEIEREMGSVEGILNDNDLEFLTMMAEDKSIPVWQITDEIEHRLNYGDWYTLSEAIEPPKQLNTKLNNALRSLIETDSVRPETVRPDLKQITEEVRNTLGKEAADFEGQFTDDDINYLANLINNGASKEELAQALNVKMATGNFGITPEVQQQVNDLFKQASMYDPNSKQFVEAQAEAYRLLANEILPNATGLEKFEAWRYLAMLGNPKTMIRNFVGNTLFNVVTGVSNNIAAVGEAGVDKAVKALGGEGIQRTKSVLNPKKDAGLIKAAFEDADASRYRQIVGSKYEKFDKNTLRQSKSVFNNKLIKLYEKATDAGISDYGAVKTKYTTSLAGYLKANGYDTNIFKAEDELARLKNLRETRLLSDAENLQIDNLTKEVDALEKARDYALKQAEYATFHEDNKMAKVLTQWSKMSKEQGTGIGHVLIEGMIPFKKTPANVLRSAYEYSPLGAIDSIKKTGKLIYENTGKRAGNLADTYINRAGKEVQKTLANDVIESWSKTLTGGGLTALGFYLFDKGILLDSDKDTKYQDQLEGLQNYSIRIGDKTYTVDWAAPAVVPLLLGAEVAKVWNAEGKETEHWYDNLDEYLNAANMIAEPLVETSMLSGVRDNLKEIASTAKNGDYSGLLTTAGYNMATGYLSQAIPTLSGQIARTIDNTRRSTYTDKEGVAGTLERQARKTMNKLPFLTQFNQPYVDTYGREQRNSPSDNPLLNLGYQMISPGYLTDVNTTNADVMSREAYDISKNENTLPKWQSYFKDDNGKRVSPEDYTTAAKAYGQANYEIREALANDDWYNSLDDAQKEEIAKGINTIAEHTGKAAIDPEYDKTSKPYQAYKEGGIPKLLDYYKDKEAGDKAKESGLGATSNAYKEIKEDIKKGNTEEAEAKISDAQKITNAGITTYGYKAYEANKSRITNTDSWINEYKKIDSYGNSDGFVNQEEFKTAAKKNKWTEEEAVKNAKLYGNWKKIPYVKKDGSWGFH